MDLRVSHSLSPFKSGSIQNLVREISGEFPKSFKFKIADEACQGLPHHCHDYSLFTHHTLLKICRLNKPPGQYFEILLHVLNKPPGQYFKLLLPPFFWEEDRTFKIQLVIASMSVISIMLP